MKTLYLLRHAKSENLAPGSTDLDRTLKESGKRQAQDLGGFLKQQNLKLDLVLCSTAARARETSEIILSSAELPAEVHYEPAIYDAEPLSLLQLISKIRNDVNTVFLVGHNPGIEDLVRLLTNRAEQISTCTLARISFDTDEWNKVAAGTGVLEQLMRP